MDFVILRRAVPPHNSTEPRRMFDGSFRTNTREINLAGASASKRSSRTSHIKQAREQRLARAAAKAESSAAGVLQRCWRGVRGGSAEYSNRPSSGFNRCGRKGVSLVLIHQYRDSIQDLLQYVGSLQDISSTDTLLSRVSQKRRHISWTASMLAFCLSPPLISFYATTKLGVETSMRQDLLSLDSLLKLFYDVTTVGGRPFISPIAARRIVITIVILLRQSFEFLSSKHILGSNDDVLNLAIIEDEDLRLVRLLNYLLRLYFIPGGNWTFGNATFEMWTPKPSDYYLSILRKHSLGDASKRDCVIGADWMINLFLCFRDSYKLERESNSNSAGQADHMDIDQESEHDMSSNEVIQRLLLKWCCHVVLHFATLEHHELIVELSSFQENVLLTYQRGLALLGSIILASGRHPPNKPTWIDEPLTHFSSSLDQLVRGETTTSGSELPLTETPSAFWTSILVHSLSRGMCAMSEVIQHQNSTTDNCNIPGLMKQFSPCSFVSFSDPWLSAVSEVLHSREHIVLEQVIFHFDKSKSRSQNNPFISTSSVPIILRYTLEHQSELAVLSSFAARGDDILRWTSSSDGKVVDSVKSGVLHADTVKAFAGEESETDSDDEQELFLHQANHPQRQNQSKQTTSAGKYSRANLQTMPKLDNLFQTSVLQSKKRYVDRFNLTASENKMQKVMLAEKIGKGELIYQLGEALFTSQPALTQAPCAALVSCSPLFWPSQAREFFTSSLAAIMTQFSGLKAGRNASSPLLAKLAFQDTLLYGLWFEASENVALILSTSLMPSSSLVSDSSKLSKAYDSFTVFCDLLSHNLLAVDDDFFIQKYHNPQNGIAANVLVVMLKDLLNDMFCIRPVLASDISSYQVILQNPSHPPFQKVPQLSFQRARLLLSGTKLWNSLYERWCRLFRTIQFCTEESWWFPHLSYRGQHDSNPIIHSQVTSVGQSIEDAESMDQISFDQGAAVSNTDAGADSLASAFRDPMMARVLTCIPQAMPFRRRVDLFQSLLESDKLLTQDETAAFQQMMMNFMDSEGNSFSGREKVTIHRDSLYMDSMKSLIPLGKRLRKKLQVTFVNKHGVEEAGIDGGGVQKEYFDDLIKDAFLPAGEQVDVNEADNSSDLSHPDFFVETSIQTLQVNTALGSSEYLRHYEFLGRVLGKTMYESILVEPQFCLPFLNKLLGKQNSLDDLNNLDPEYYKHLNSLRHMSTSDIKEMGLTFEMTTLDPATRWGHNSTSTVELTPGGSSIQVTKDNVIQYIHLLSHQRMNVLGARQTAAFLHGFREIIPAPWVRLFSAYEFQKLISGDDTVKGIDVRGMMLVMRYSGGFHPSQPIIQWLWEVVDEMSPSQQRKFLRFMTSCSRQPLLGFNSLVPAPCVQQTRLREDDHGNDVSDELNMGNIRLPTSSTCMNLLKLPKYPSKAMLKEKLVYAIESAAGFELS